MRQACIFWILLTLGMTLGVVADVAFGAPHNGSISGLVVDAGTGNPVENALVQLTPSNRQATTGADGWYTIEEVAPGTYAVIITHPDFEQRKISGVSVKVAQPVVVSASLTRKGSSRENNYKSKQQGQADSASPQEQQRATSESLMKKPVAPQVSSGNMAPRQDNYRGSTQSLMPVPVAPYQPPYYQTPGDMYFRDYGTNDFVDTRRDRLSTFGLDVDDASYTLARTYLMDGNLPPTEAIRVEEFVNHFNYGYNPPDESKFRIFTELTESPFDRGTTIMKIGVKGREINDYQRKPVNLTLVIDVSGSMQWGNRLDLVKQSIGMLVEQLEGDDQVGIVAYGSQAFTVLDPTPADRKKVILRSLDRLHAGGSTFAEAGLRLGYEMANRQYRERHNNVVALCSDGVANVGQTSPEGIMRDIKRFARQGIVLSTFGVGMGNYNDVLLEQLAKQGNGKYAYIDTPEQARKLFVDELVGSIQVLARDVKVQVEFNPATVRSYRLIGYENRAIADQKFRDNRQDGGEVGAGHEVTALYEVVLTGRHAENLATVFVRWKDAEQTEVTEVAQDVSLDRYTRRFEAARPELRLAIVAARFAEMLKQTEYSAETSYDELYRMSQRIAHQMPNEQTEELVNLIERARSLSTYHTDQYYPEG